MSIYKANWQDLKNIQNIRFECGYCGADTAPAYGWYSNAYTEGDKYQGYVAICTNCNKPSFIDVKHPNFNIRTLVPSPKMGNEVDGLPQDLEKLYEEARICTSSGAYTSAVLTCRKILMHVAVEKKAKPNLKFIDYVDYLATNGYVPPDGKDWVDYIRTKANEANHEIRVMSREDAGDLITFTEMLLRLVYEFKNRLSKRNSPSGTE
jgi:hypothetical protein